MGVRRYDEYPVTGIVFVAVGAGEAEPTVN